MASARPPEPRAADSRFEDLIAPRSPEMLAREVDALPETQRLVVTGDQEVWIARADQIPTLLFEIGRLRETAFREVGEGTGFEVDLDGYDLYYQHMFLWHRGRREIVGGYRLGLTDQILASRGVSGLYTSTLFEFDPQLFEEMGPSIELGRSFIGLEHQKSYASLLTLWKGIGTFVARNPRSPTLFGPVSISDRYKSESQRAIVTFLRQNRYTHPWSRWVHARNPFRLGWRRPKFARRNRLERLEDVSELISRIESDRKRVPILLKQYMKLGGTLLGFNIDPHFSDVLDVLTMVDLRRTDRKALRRYMGREGVEAFLAHHDGSSTKAG
jgi:putative hemolysin